MQKSNEIYRISFDYIIVNLKKLITKSTINLLPEKK